MEGSFSDIAVIIAVMIMAGVSRIPKPGIRSKPVSPDSWLLTLDS
jgi:hypothetical protein